MIDYFGRSHNTLSSLTGDVPSLSEQAGTKGPVTNEAAALGQGVETDKGCGRLMGLGEALCLHLFNTQR